LEADIRNPLRKIGFYLTVVFVFLRFSMIHEVLGGMYGITNIVVVIGAPCVLLLVLSGGIQRTLANRSALFFAGMMFWLFLSVPFSNWRGGSFVAVTAYARTSFIILPLIVGMVLTWRECWILLYAVALGGAVDALMGRFLADTSTGRLSLGLKGGSVTNANDLAAHLILVTAFILLMFWAGGRNVVKRFFFLTMALLSVYEIASSGSRGAMIAMIIVFIFMVSKASPAVRLATLISAPVLLAGMVLVLPKATLTRYATLFQEEAKIEDSGAEASTQARSYLLKTSFLLSLRNPLFGVGPGEFEDSEAKAAAEAGRRGSWAVPHNAYTQLSSEAGFPALFCLVASLLSSFRMLSGTVRRAKRDTRFKQFEMAAYFTQLGMIGFCVASFFLSLAYHFYFPAIAGVAMVVSITAQREMDRKAAAAAVPTTSVRPPVLTQTLHIGPRPGTR
jgi:O-antigen ligase